MFGISTTELLVIVLIILLLFGGKKIPELMKGMGRGVKSFKEGMNEVERDLRVDSSADTQPAGGNSQSAASSSQPSAASSQASAQSKPEAEQ